MDYSANRPFSPRLSSVLVMAANGKHFKGCPFENSYMVKSQSIPEEPFLPYFGLSILNSV